MVESVPMAPNDRPVDVIVTADGQIGGKARSAAMPETHYQ